MATDKPDMEIDMPDVSDLPCPVCRELTLKIELRPKTTPVGSFQIAGMTIPVAAQEWPWIVCTLCGVESEGEMA